MSAEDVTYESLLPKCRTKGEPCELWPDLMTPVHATGWSMVWTLVAIVVVCLVFALRGRTGAWTVIELGCGFWVLLWIVALLLGLHRGDFAVVAVPVVAYGLAWAVAGRAVPLMARSPTSRHDRSHEDGDGGVGGRGVRVRVVRVDRAGRRPPVPG